VSFLNQLKSQAHALQDQRGTSQRGLEENTARTENASRVVRDYLDDLARQLNVIEPPAPRFTLDGRTPWPAMKLIDFRVDARRKMLRGHEAFDYVAMGWRVVPRVGQAVSSIVRVNFPPDLQRVESRLMMGPVKHERREVRHPEKNSLLAFEFEYLTQTRGSVTVTPDHDKGVLAFRVMNGSGFGIVQKSFAAGNVNTGLMDELAKLLVDQPNGFA